VRRCFQKRHSLDGSRSPSRSATDYNYASVATHTEAEEIVAEATDFLEPVEHWIAANHPKLNP